MRSTVILLTATSFLSNVSPPAQNAPPFTFTNKQHMVILPYEQWKDRLFIKGKVNDSRDLDFLFDPTAQMSSVVLDTSFSREMGKSPDTVTLALRTLLIHEQHIAWSSLKDIELQSGHSVNGLLGYNFVRRFVIRIDPRNKRIILTDPAYFAAGMLKGKISLAGSVPDLTALLKKGKTVTLDYERQYMVVSE